MSMSNFVVILMLFSVILISGCLETQELFEDKGTNIENNKFCRDYCDSVDDTKQFLEVECEQTQCVCKCKIFWW